MDFARMVDAMITKLGIPYMGSKRKIAKPILDFIIRNNPNCKYIYDLFGGGGAISFMAVQYPQIKKVFYNELNTGITELLKKVLSDGVTPEMYKWIDREEYFAHRFDPTWYGGLLSTIWSFGNNSERAYLFGIHIENTKKLMHKIVVNKCNESLIKLEEELNIKIVLEKEGIHNRRLELSSIIKGKIKDIKLQRPESLEQLERLEQLQRLQRLQQPEQLRKLDVSNLSFENVKIATPIDETIIYLDPPYKGTEKYIHGICHNKLIDYIKTSPYKIYVSSYEFPELKEVLKIEHRCTLSSTSNNAVVEKLFCNRLGDKIYTQGELL
jgi:adenine-specific DNA methylase